MVGNMKDLLGKILGIGFSLIIATSSEIAPTNFKDPNWLKHVESYDYVNQVGPEVIRCLKERDRDGLNDLFCDKVKDTEYLQKEMDFLFDYIDKNGGLKIEEGAQWTVPGEHRTSSDKGGGRVVNFFGCLYRGSVFIGTKRYILRFSSYAILKKHLEYVGVIKISFMQPSDFNGLSEYEKLKRINAPVTEDSYLGFYITAFNKEKYDFEEVIPENMYKIEEYKYSFDELEKGASNW